jgi:signal transduction histidine kinase
LHVLTMILGLLTVSSREIYKVKIIKDFQPDLPLVPCIENELEQVVLNLLNNAASAMTDEKMESPPQIQLVIKANQKTARIEVKDNGPGIDDETKKRIFEPFFTTKPVGEGTGLGLSVSFMIITSNHKGTIEVQSEIGKGTRFIIQLPLTNK